MQDQQAQSHGLPALASASSVAVLLFLIYESATSRINQRVVVPMLGSGILHTLSQSSPLSSFRTSWHLRRGPSPGQWSLPLPLPCLQGCRCPVGS